MIAARLAVVALVLALVSAWTHARPRAAASGLDVAAVVPFGFEEWLGRDAPPLDPEIARVLAADQYVHRYYGSRVSGDGEPVEMDVAYYAQPQAGASMHSPLNCLPGNGWQVMESGEAAVPVAGETVRIRSLVVARDGYRVAMTYWFQNRGAVVGHEYRQRLQLLGNGLRGRPTDAALVRVMARDGAAGRAALTRFTRDLLALLAPAFR